MASRKRKPRPIEIPCLVLSYTVPEAQIVLLTALNAFLEGWATTSHFDVLLDTRDLLVLGASAKNDDDVVIVADVANAALSNIKASFDGAAFHPSEDELNALRLLVDVSNDFWNRQTGLLYRAAYTALREWRQEQEREKNENQGDAGGTD